MVRAKQKFNYSGEGLMAQAGDTVTIACKFPNGILMSVYDMKDHQVPVLGGGQRTEKRAAAIGEPIKINGPASLEGVSPKCEVVGGYALTFGVPADIAKKWFEDNKDSPLVRNNIIYISANADRARAQGKEMKGERSGFERLDVSTIHQNGREIPKDPRWPRSINPNISDVATDERNT
jgi:hypothetical protein